MFVCNIGGDERDIGERAQECGGIEMIEGIYIVVGFGKRTVEMQGERPDVTSSNAG